MTYFPIVFVVSNSLKSGQNIFSSGVFSLFTQFDYQNYVTAWSGIGAPLVQHGHRRRLTIVIGVTAAALGAYAFSQLRFRGKELLFMAYVALLLVPSTLTLIPLFLTIQKLHLFNTWWALVLPYAASAQPLLVLIFRGFFDQIPRELLESARVDGCTERQVLGRIVAPLTRPVLLTGAVLVTINVWGDYLWPTIVIQDPQRTTISAGLQQFVGSFGLNLTGGGAVFAAFVIATVPDVRPRRLHHALFRLGPHRRSNQAVTAPPLTPAGLRCAHQVNPLGIAPDRVRLSWTLDGQGPAARSAPTRCWSPGTGNRWPRAVTCRGTAAGSSPRSSADIPYAGSRWPAGAGTRWQVRVWDDQGQASALERPGRVRGRAGPGRRAGWPPGSAVAGPGRASRRPPGPARSTRSRAR